MPTRTARSYPLPRAKSFQEACSLAAKQLRTNVIYFHAAALITTGGEPGFHSEAALDAAVHRPFVVYGDESPYKDSLEQAAALFQSLICNHAFLDANKRAGTSACLYFLEYSGYWRGMALLTDKERNQLFQLSIRVAQGGYQHPRIVQELRRILEPTRNPRGQLPPLQLACVHWCHPPVSPFFLGGT